MTEPQRNLMAHQRELLLARPVVAQLRDLEAVDPLHVGSRALEAAALYSLQDRLDRIDSHFRWVEEQDRIRRGAFKEQRPRTWRKMWTPAMKMLASHLRWTGRQVGNHEYTPSP